MGEDGGGLVAHYLATKIVRERVLGETSGHGTTGVAIVLGRGMRLWDDLRELERDYSVTSEVAESGVIHFAFAR